MALSTADRQRRFRATHEIVLRQQAPVVPDFTAVRQALEDARALLRNTSPTPGAMYRQLSSVLAVITALVQALDDHAPRP